MISKSLSFILEGILKRNISFAKEYHHIPDGYDGTEICDWNLLVVICILTLLATIIKKSYCGLYRYYGLLILRNVNGQ